MKASEHKSVDNEYKKLIMETEIIENTKQGKEYQLYISELRNSFSNYSNLLKKNRHYRSKVFILSQYLNDLKPEAIKQSDYMLIWGGQSIDKLKLVHKHLDLSLKFDKSCDLMVVTISVTYFTISSLNFLGVYLPFSI